VSILPIARSPLVALVSSSPGLARAQRLGRPGAGSRSVSVLLVVSFQTTNSKSTCDDEHQLAASDSKTGLQCGSKIPAPFIDDANMTSQLLASELANLIQESKRKHNDLRQVGNVALSLRTVPQLQNGEATPPPLPPTAS
jgi:hypothetical protein